MIVGNIIGGNPITPKTYILTTESGQEVNAVLVDKETIFTATDNDVRLGSTYASDKGFSTGTKIIPSYHTVQGTKLITKGSALTIPNANAEIDSYDYTNMQAIVCVYNTNIANSVAASQVSIEGNIYNVQSTEVISSVVKNHDSKIIEFGIVNDTDSLLIIRFFMYKEIV